jgi:hypothetical protein
MDEMEWLKSTEIEPMVRHLWRTGVGPNGRKMRLFACACCRQMWRLVKDERSRAAVETSELYADGKATAKGLAAAAREANRAADELAFEASVSMRLAKWAARDAATTAWWAAQRHLDVLETAKAAQSAVTYTPDRPKDQGLLLRDIFGNPFRPAPSIERATLAWNDSTVVRLATAIYEERSFDRMAILADALEEAGCEDSEIPGHCRQLGAVHVRGCHVIDWLLGKR